MQVAKLKLLVSFHRWMLPLIAQTPFLSMKEDSCWRRQNVVLERGEIASDASKVQQAVQAELKAYFLIRTYLVMRINSY